MHLSGLPSAATNGLVTSVLLHQRQRKNAIFIEKGGLEDGYEKIRS
jgi:hypothetical protein